MPPAAAPVSGGARAAGYKPRPTAGRPDAFDDPGPEFSAPTKTDMRAMRGRARRSDAAERERYEREDAPNTDRSAGRGAPKKGGGGTKVRATRTSKGLTVGGKRIRPANVLRGRPVVSGGSPIEEGAGFLLGLFLYALTLNFLKYGPDGLRGWLAAKFFNQPYAKAAAPPPSPFAPSSPAPAPAPAKPTSSPYPSTGVLV